MARLFLCCIVFLAGIPHVASAGSVKPKTADAKPAATAEQTRRANMEKIILAKLAFYARHFQQIDFVLLNSEGQTSRNMGALHRLIGRNPEPLDYDHPESLHDILLELTYARIRFLLENGVGSATLFAPGEGAQLKRKQVCVVTMDPWKIAADNLAATRHLLEISDANISGISPSQYLDADSHLRFALDHEIYHCLDTSINGPVPRSKQRAWGEYYMLRNESGADAFGIIMNLSKSGSVTAYARNLMLVRGLTLLNDDPNHYTYPAINAVLQLDATQLAKNDVYGRFRLASRIRDKAVGSYRQFLHYAVAAESAMKQLGHRPEKEKFGDLAVDRQMVKNIVSQVKSNYRSLVGHALQGMK